MPGKRERALLKAQREHVFNADLATIQRVQMRERETVRSSLDLRSNWSVQPSEHLAMPTYAWHYSSQRGRRKARVVSGM
jgi:hypothetical protein